MPSGAVYGAPTAVRTIEKKRARADYKNISLISLASNVPPL